MKHVFRGFVPAIGVFIIASLAMTITSCDSDPNSKTGTGSIYGVVTNANGDILSGVAVTLGIPASNSLGIYQEEALVEYEILLKTVTSSDGSYEFTDLKPRTYVLAVQSAEYELFQERITVEGSRKARADIYLKPINTGITFKYLAAEVISNLVILSGNVTSNSSKISEVGFFYSTTSNPKEGDQISAKYYWNGDHYYQSELPNLKAGKYYFQMFAKNNAGIAYSDIFTFEISPHPVLITLKATDVDETSAILNGEIEYAGDPEYKERGFIYSTEYLTPTLDNGIKIYISGKGCGEFQYKLRNLETDVTYYYRAYAITDSDVFYGDVESFITQNPDYVVLKGIGLMVQTRDLGKGPMQEAIEACSNSRVGGYQDWRLPSLSELNLLYENRKLIGGFEPEFYWSTTIAYTNANHPDLHEYYCVDFTDGENKSFWYSESRRVRAVRSL